MTSANFNVADSGSRRTLPQKRFFASARVAEPPAAPQAELEPTASEALPPTEPLPFVPCPLPDAHLQG